MNRIKGVIYALLSSAAFGLMPIFAKFMYNDGLNTPTVLSLRFLLAAIMLLIYFLIKRIDLKVNRTQLLLLSLIGALGYTSTGLGLFYSYNYISVGLATTMHFVYPAVVMGLNYLVYKEGFTKYKLTALLLSAAGVYTLIGINAQGIHPGGALLAITSGFTYAACVIGMNHSEIKKLNNLVTVFYFSLASGLVLLIFTLSTNQLNLHVNSEILISAAGISLVSTIIAIGLFVKAAKIIGTSSASILGTFEPIVSIVMGIILFKEPLTLTLVLGTMLVLSSVVILARENKTTSNGSNPNNLSETETNSKTA